jgi:hypothetical protein
MSNKHKTPLLDRKGGLWRSAEGDETEAGVVDFLNLIPPPRRAKFASLICLGTPPVQVFHPDRAKRVSGRGVFVGESLHFNMLIFNELQIRHYKRSEVSPPPPFQTLASLGSCPGVSSRPIEESVGKGKFWRVISSLPKAESFLRKTFN